MKEVDQTSYLKHFQENRICTKKLSIKFNLINENALKLIIFKLQRRQRENAKKTIKLNINNYLQP